jgi:hypothetical protein
VWRLPRLFSCVPDNISFNASRRFLISLAFPKMERRPQFLLAPAAAAMGLPLYGCHETETQLRSKDAVYAATAVHPACAATADLWVKRSPSLNRMNGTCPTAPTSHSFTAPNLRARSLEDGDVRHMWGALAAGFSCAHVGTEHGYARGKYLPHAPTLTHCAHASQLRCADGSEGDGQRGGWEAHRMEHCHVG